MNLTRHASKRLRQRGKSEDDVALIIKNGTSVRDGYLLRGRDADARIDDLKREILRIERLKGWAVVTDPEHETAFTVYAARHRKQRRRLWRH